MHPRESFYDFSIKLSIIGENYLSIYKNADTFKTSGIESKSLYLRAFIDGTKVHHWHIQIEAISYLCKYYSCFEPDPDDLKYEAIQSCLSSEWLDVIDATLKVLQKCIHLMTNLQLNKVLR